MARLIAAMTVGVKCLVVPVITNQFVGPSKNSGFRRSFLQRQLALANKRSAFVDAGPQLLIGLLNDAAVASIPFIRHEKSLIYVYPTDANPLTTIVCLNSSRELLS